MSFILKYPYLKYVVIIMITMIATWLISNKSINIYPQTEHVSGLNTPELIQPDIQTDYAPSIHVANHVVKGCKPKNISQAKFYSQSREDVALFNNYFNTPVICNGVYVEIGALDGVWISNTKFFEDTLHWTGVLIEANPHNAKRLQKNRSSKNNKIIHGAVCPEGQSHVNFTGHGGVGGVPEEMMDEHIKHWFKGALPALITVPCQSLGRMLTEAGITAIDMFSLDVEGAELMVLQTMDWSIPVKVWVIEMGRGDRDQILINLLHEHGYRKSIWNIRGFCQPGKACTNNQVFEHLNYVY